jgi:hypothetical protein
MLRFELEKPTTAASDGMASARTTSHNLDVALDLARAGSNPDQARRKIFFRSAGDALLKGMWHDQKD